MIYEVNIHEGIEGLDFGSSVDTVRAHFSEEYESYIMGESLGILKDNFPTDFYKKLGVFCYYDNFGLLEALEFITPSSPRLNRKNMLSMSAKDSVAFLRNLDAELDVNVVRAISHSLSLSVVFSYDDDGDDVVISSFLVGRPGYYEGV